MAKNDIFLLLCCITPYGAFQKQQTKEIKEEKMVMISAKTEEAPKVPLHSGGRKCCEENTHRDRDFSFISATNSIFL